MGASLHTDVVVIGGGSAGIAAAIACARQGLQVVLVEMNAYPGGKATAAEVGTVCGLYTFNKSENAEFLVKGFAKEFAELLQNKSNTKPLFNTDGLHYLPYNIESFKTVSFNLLQENNVSVYFNAALKSVQTNNQKIIAVSIQTKNNSILIHLKSIIDCSGISIISRLANLPFIESSHYQAAAQVFTMQGINETSEARLGLIIMKAISNAIAKNQLAEFYNRIYIVPGSLKNNSISFKIGIPLAVTNTPENLQQLKTLAHGFIETLSKFLIFNVSTFKNASVKNIAPEVGIRVAHRSIGKYILTEEDVLLCKKFDDGIANGSWPIEEWEQDKRVKMRYLPVDDFYRIPATSLQSASIDNLFFAGRNISATDAAIASARVMGICLQTGYAAGCLAAASAKNISIADAIVKIQTDQL
ncbi:MAG TPA: FAD-dependent oxidoreductase [Ferruginibacter sp.]|nr:FAD-dependent oxidoreductase [Ferruginibacter sp.]